MNAHKHVRAGRAFRQASWLLPGILLLVAVIAMAASSGTTDREPLAANSGAVPSALQPNAAETGAHTPEGTASTLVATPLPVDTVRTEAEVTGIALDRLAEMSAQATELKLTPNATKLESVVATRWVDVNDFTSRLGVPPESADAEQVVWVARGQGTFLVTRGGYGLHEPWVGETGYLLIDDATGEIVGMGTP